MYELRSQKKIEQFVHRIVTLRLKFPTFRRGLNPLTLSFKHGPHCIFFALELVEFLNFWLSKICQKFLFLSQNVNPNMENLGKKLKL